MAHILVVEDEITLLKTIQMMLRKAGHDVCGESSGKDALRLLQDEGKEGRGLRFDVVLTDYRLKDITGLDVLRAVKRIDNSTQVLLMTAFASTQTAVEAMKDGAFDYIEKPFKYDQLVGLIEKAVARRDMSRSSVVELAGSSRAFAHIIGDSEPMKDVIDMVCRVAPTKANILITGESGTGKEVIARAIHQLSGVTGACVPVNCGAIPETLVESELFGYAKGAFTGASRDKEGFFQAAAGGTIFLDEVGELPLSMQVKLLRALQEKKVQPVGSTAEVPVSARIIAATNRDLRAEVAARRFREDLFFRLNVIQISLPPLRDRREDIPKLAHYFLQKFNRELGKSITGVDADVLALLSNYDYRGNVRELENIIEHAVTLEKSRSVSYGALPAYLRSELTGCDDPCVSSQPSDPRLCWMSSAENPSVAAAVRNEKMPGVEEVLNGISLGGGVELESVVEDIERRLISRALEKTGGNKTEAAKLLGISFRSLRYRLKKYGFES